VPDVQLRVKVRVWGFRPQSRLVKVEADGTVRVWDSVARHFTLRHDMTSRDKARIRKMADSWRWAHGA
jgi:hypothetical protein